jgi:hypothetical protein
MLRRRTALLKEVFMSAAKIPSIRERMRRQEILTRELGGVPLESNNRMSIAGKRGAERGPMRAATRGKTAIRNAGPFSPNPSARGRDRGSRSSLPGFASLIRKVIAY